MANITPSQDSPPVAGQISNLKNGTPPHHLSLGKWGEEIAKQEYQKLGYKVLESNVYNESGMRMGEIDFVAVRDSLVAFVEVKTRTGQDELESALEAVSAQKQRKILKAVKSYLLHSPELMEKYLSLDVVAVLVDKLDNSKFSVTILENVIEGR